MVGVVEFICSGKEHGAQVAIGQEGEDVVEVGIKTVVVGEDDVVAGVVVGKNVSFKKVGEDDVVGGRHGEGVAAVDVVGHSSTLVPG